jgi:hypothetical protein
MNETSGLSGMERILQEGGRLLAEPAAPTPKRLKVDRQSALSPSTGEKYPGMRT